MVKYALYSNSFSGSLFHEAEFKCFFPSKFYLSHSKYDVSQTPALKYLSVLVFGIDEFWSFFGHFIGIYLFICLGCAVQLAGSYFPDQGLNQGPWQ